MAILAIAAVSCRKQEAGSGSGAVNFAITGNEGASVMDVVKSAVSDYTTIPGADKFTLSITNSSDAVVWSGKFDEWVAGVNKLTAGDYKVSASFGSSDDEGFDKPYFSGSKTFTVQGEKTTDVTVNVSLGNCIVKIVTTEQFRNYYPVYDFSITSGNGSTFGISQTETRAIFIDAYKFTVSGTLENQNGNQFIFAPKSYESLEAATCYTLKFDASGVGGATITISFDNTVVEVEPVELEINE